MLTAAMTAMRSAQGRRQGRRGPLKATPEALERAALAYLERYASSAAHLRRLLLAKVGRSARWHGTDPEAGSRAVDDIVTRFRRSGLLDDDAYARGRALSLHRAGASARAIRARLRAKGVDEETIARALAGLAEEAKEPELAAALAYARRRRLGPFRPAAERAERRERDLAALGRRGFSYEMALRVIDAADAETLAAEAAET